MANVGSLIEAIKVIRNLPVVIEDGLSEAGVKIQKIKVNISLKEAKDLVEDIMSLGGAQRERMWVLSQNIQDLQKENAELKDKLKSAKANAQFLIGRL